MHLLILAWGFVRVALILFFVAVTALANERNVVEGDILHSFTAESKDEATAAFLAQQGAIKSLVTECSIAHRNIKIYQSFTQKYADQKFIGVAEAGIDFQSCEEGKKTSLKDQRKLISPEIKKNQEIYEQYLRSKLGLRK